MLPQEGLELHAHQFGLYFEHGIMPCKDFKQEVRLLDLGGSKLCVGLVVGRSLEAGGWQTGLCFAAGETEDGEMGRSYSFGGNRRDRSW